MYGRDTDRLWMAVEEYETKPLKNLFFRSNLQRKTWRYKTKVFKTENNFKIIIQGAIKNDTHNSGYIAVDDVKMFPEECPQHCSHPKILGRSIVGDFWEGSVVYINITCKEGFEIKGNSSIVCQYNGKWSDTPTCQAVDCSDPTPMSGDVNSTDFKIGSVVQVTCATGFKLVGTPQIVCLINSTWSDNQVCKRIECSKPILTTGLLEPNGTTWYPNQFILLACADGNTLRGNAKITCQESGNWTILPTCDYNEESFSGDLIAVAVTVPIIAICILVIITVAFCRKRTFWCMEGDKTSEQDMNRQNQLPQNTYGNSGINTDSYPADESLGLDTVYAVISKKNPPELKDDDFYNTVKYGTNVTNNVDYDHMKMSFEPVLDNTYSKIQDNNIDSRNKPGKNSTDSYSYTNAAFQEVDDEYNHINLNRPNESVKQNTSVSMNTYKEHESEYDHAKAGGCDSNTLDRDEYSHLNKAVVGHKDRLAKTSNLSLDNPVRIEQEIETEYGESTDTQIYFNVEKEEDSYTQEEDRYEIVSENEKKNVEYFNEDQHDYFILEKSE